MKKKYVFITGGATGIGFATSKKFAAMGWEVISTVLPNQNRDELSSVANVQIIELDITDEKMVQDAAERVSNIVGDNGLALLINNAGIANVGSGALEGVSMSAIHFLYEVNLFGTMRVIQSFLPLLRQYGKARIINLASGAVRAPVPFAAVYNSSKYAVVGMSKTLRYELAPFGIQVACIEPSSVKSEMTADHEKNMEITWSKMTPESVELYREPLAPILGWLSDQIVHAIEPEEVAKKIYKVSQKQKMKIRYGGGKMAEMLSFMEGVMGENLLEKMLSGMMKVPKDKFIGRE